MVVTTVFGAVGRGSSPRGATKSGSRRLGSIPGGPTKQYVYEKQFRLQRNAKGQMS